MKKKLFTIIIQILKYKMINMLNQTPTYMQKITARPNVQIVWYLLLKY